VPFLRIIGERSWELLYGMYFQPTHGGEVQGVIFSLLSEPSAIAGPARSEFALVLDDSQESPEP
jgi:hypothetical protein